MISTTPTTEPQLQEVLAEKDRLLAEKTVLEEENEQLRRRIRLLEKALFGPRSERIVDDPPEQGRFEDLLAEYRELNEIVEEVEKETVRVEPTAVRRRKPRRNLQQLIPDDLPEEEIVVDLPEAEKTCPETGEPRVRIGEARVEKLAYRPGSYYKKVFVYLKYACPDHPLHGVVSAPSPDFAVRGSVFDESFMAGIVTDKCVYHLPLYRQEEKMRSLGIEIGRQTLCRQYLAAADVLRPIYDRMKEIILERGVIFTDDTVTRLQVKGRGKTVNGRMWVYIGGGPGPPYRLFEFTVDRKKERPKAFLGDYRGYIHADAYKGYADLFEREGVIECACWMHVRRKFVEAEDGPPELRAGILHLIRGLYRYERVLAGKPAETVVAVRGARTAKLIDRIFGLAGEAVRAQRILPQSGMGKAIGYLLGRGNALRTFLADARLKPDNGTSERAIRPLTIGRKNWLFAGSKRGGDATGILLSIVQSCRVLDIEPFRYLDDVLRRIQGHPANRLDELLPHNWTPAAKYYS